MAHDPFDFAALPPDVITQARRALGDALRDPGSCPYLGVYFGWWVEAHTPGCLAEAGEPDADRPAALAALFDVYLRDGASFVMGDPSQGAFVSATPHELRPSGLGAAAPGWSLGQVREKVRVPLELGEQVARKVRKEVEPLAQAMVLAGSIRRRRPQIADVEFVVLPKNLKAFDRAVREMGYAGGAKMRIYKRAVDGITVELYAAHEIEEMGSMVLMYTGDWKFNMAMRAKTKRMGYKLDQYGISKEGEVVFQSPDEREFFDFIGMAWHDPEERSLARREELRDMAKKLRAIAGDLPSGEARFVDEASKAVKTRKPLSPDDEAELERIYKKHYGEAGAEVGGAHASMGAEELLELGDRREDVLSEWQHGYDRAVGRGGRIRDVFADLGSAGLAVWVEVDEDGRIVYYSPHVDQEPSEGDVAAYEADEESWMGAVTGAADWGRSDWGPPRFSPDL